MLEDSQYVSAPDPVQQSDDRPLARRDGSIARAGVWFFVIASFMLLALSGVATWRWVDRNLLHWGVSDGPTETVNHAELLERVRAFELVAVKHTYAGDAHVDLTKVLNAGPVRLSLPGWAAGQELDVTGKVAVSAGVDMSRVGPEDMQITQQGNDAHVVIRLPAPELLSAELVPNSLDMSTSAGLITRFRQRVGVEEDDLRDRAADEVILVAREAAIEQGILDDAARETERRLQSFLQSLPQPGGRVTYTVVVRDPATQ
jgi:hypothetical protein